MPHILTMTSEQYKNMFKSTSRRRTNAFSIATHPNPASYSTGMTDVEANKNLIMLNPNARPTQFRNSFEECIFIFTVMMATAATTFVQGVIVIETSTIAKSLKMTAAQTEWISAAIGLASGAFTLFFGKTADIFGQKYQLLCGMAWLSLFSLAASFARSPITLNVLCGFIGLGTAIISPPAIGTMFATYPEGRRRNKVVGALGAANPFGFILGSISSGVTTKYWTWRASFYTISAFFSLMTILAFWTMPKLPRSGNTRMQMRQFDYLGTALTIVGMALFSAGLTQGPELGWKSIPVIVILTLGVACIVGFGVWENIFKHPLLNPVVWKNRTFTLCVLSTMFGYMSFITNQFWISLYLQEVQKLTPLSIAVRLLPQAIAGILWSYIGQALTSRVNGSIIMGIGGVAYVAGAILVFFIRENSSYWHFLFPALLITVIGADFQFIISNLYITKQMPRQSSLAAGVLQTATRLSISIGLAITAAAYGSQKNSLRGRKDVNLPYSRAYLCSIIFAAIGLVFIPFMKIGTQGGKSVSHVSEPVEVAEEEKPNSLVFNGEVCNNPGSTTESTKVASKPTDSGSSIWSNATEGMVTNFDDSYFPRWSWEDNGPREDRYQGAEVVYEVCVNCREERKVVVGVSEDEVSESCSNSIHGSIGLEGQGPTAEKMGGKRGGMLWNGGQWNPAWDREWYAQRGVNGGGSGWV